MGHDPLLQLYLFTALLQVFSIFDEPINILSSS